MCEQSLTAYSSEAEKEVRIVGTNGAEGYGVIESQNVPRRKGPTGLSVPSPMQHPQPYVRAASQCSHGQEHRGWGGVRQCIWPGEKWVLAERK